MKERLLRSVYRGTAVLVGLGSALVVLELALRAGWDPPVLRSVQAFGDHPVYGAAPIPGLSERVAKPEYEHAFRHTLQGLRGDREFTAERPPGVTRRVLFLGDSFTYGLGSSDRETFVARLAARWPTAEVANTGSNGYGTREELAVLDEFGAAFRPDLTVLVFFWNDLEDNAKRDAIRYELDEDGRVRRRAPDAEIDPLALHEAGDVTPLLDERPYVSLFFKYGLQELRYRTLGIKPRFIRDEAGREAAWEVTEEYLGLVAARADELGTRLVVVSLPDHNQVDPEATIRNIGPFNFEVQERLAEVCSDLGLPLIDLLDGMREEFARERRALYYYADRHLTPEGNRVVAELLARELAPHLEAGALTASR